jgi:hypothetical protein
LDALLIAAISYDKKRLSENMPPSITQSEGNKGIQAQLQELSNRLTESERADKARVVSEQKKDDLEE